MQNDRRDSKYTEWRPIVSEDGGNNKLEVNTESDSMGKWKRLNLHISFINILGYKQCDKCKQCKVKP